MVVQPTLLVPFFTGETIPFPSKAAEAGSAVKCIFLTVNQVTCFIDHHIAAAQVITEVVFHGWSRVVSEWRTDTDQCNAAVIVHHMQRVVFLRRATLDDAVMFEDA